MNKNTARKEVQRAYEEAIELRDQGMTGLMEVCRAAHDLGISDEQISIWTHEGYSRSRIQQIRTGKIRRCKS